MFQRVLPLALLLILLSCGQNSNAPQSDQNSGASLRTQTALNTLESNQNSLLGIPENSNTRAEVIISRKQYVLSWNHENRSPNWVAWKLSKNDLGHSGRSSSFYADSSLGKFLSEKELGTNVGPKDYQGSCFDRGHAVPSGDRTASGLDNKATFLMSNVAPQTAFLNRVSWEHLETYERDLAKNGKTIYIYAGPIYDQLLGNIGPGNNIRVPSKFFKILVALDENQDISQVDRHTPMTIVIMPNKTSTGAWPDDRTSLCADFNRLAGPQNEEDWKAYQTTLEDVETQTGFVFFEKTNVPTLSPVIED